MSDPRNPNPNAFASISPFLKLLPPGERISEAKFYEFVRKGEIPVYRLPGRKGSFVKYGEARAALAALVAQGKIRRRGYGSFGPDAVVRDLSNVAGQDFEVLS